MCGHLGGALGINLPGPFVLALAAMSAFCRTAVLDPDSINEAMTRAVLATYPGGAELL